MRDHLPGLALAFAGQVASTRIRQALVGHGLKPGHAHVLAARRRDPADRRRHIVEISPSGMRLVADVYESIAAVEAELFADLGASEVGTLQGLLARIKASADDEACKAE